MTCYSLSVRLCFASESVFAIYHVKGPQYQIKSIICSISSSVLYLQGMIACLSLEVVLPDQFHYIFFCELMLYSLSEDVYELVLD